MISILFIEDDELDIQLALFALEKSGLVVETRVVDSSTAFVEAIQHRCPNLIISDHGMARFDIYQALQLKNEVCPGVPFIVLTGGRDPLENERLMKSGVQAYVLKSQLHKLPEVIRQVCRPS